MNTTRKMTMGNSQNCSPYLFLLPLPSGLWKSHDKIGGPLCITFSKTTIVLCPQPLWMHMSYKIICCPISIMGYVNYCSSISIIGCINYRSVISIMGCVNYHRQMYIMGCVNFRSSISIMSCKFLWVTFKICSLIVI